MQPNYLEELKDIHMPPPPGLLPLSFNLNMVIAAILIIFIYILFIYFKNKKRRKIKKEALLNFNTIKNNFLRSNNNAELQNDLSILIKRIIASSKNNKNIFKIFNKELYLALEKELQIDRFKKEPNINGQKLLELSSELIKKCRI
jgi:hypothetical protein